MMVYYDSFRLNDALKSSIEGMETTPNDNWFYPLSELIRHLSTGVYPLVN